MRKQIKHNFPRTWGTAPDAEIAARLKRSIKSVQCRRLDVLSRARKTFTGSVVKWNPTATNTNEPDRD
jgi:hypothetical protein